MQQGWHWEIFLQNAPFGGVTYLHWLLSGLLLTVLLFICSWILAFVIGTLLGIMRTTSNRPLRALAIIYVGIFRNVPLIVQFFIWYLLVPEILPASAEHWLKAVIHPNTQFFLLSVGCLAFFTGARIAEQVRAGIEAIPIDQKFAGLALGLSIPQTYAHVLLPNALRTILPPLTSEMLNLVKNTAVASTIGLLELTSQANRLLEYSGFAYESFIAVTFAYFALNFVVMHIMRLVEQKSARPVGGG